MEAGQAGRRVLLARRHSVVVKAFVPGRQLPLFSALLYFIFEGSLGAVSTVLLSGPPVSFEELPLLSYFCFCSPSVPLFCFIHTQAGYSFYVCVICSFCIYFFSCSGKVAFFFFSFFSGRILDQTVILFSSVLKGTSLY